MEILNVLFQVFVAILVMLFAVPVVPGLIKSLSNNPNHRRVGNPSSERNYKASDFGFFTALEPGQVKIIEAADRFITCIMRYDEHYFQGELPENSDLNPRSSEYWEVTKKPGTIGSFPIHFPRFLTYSSVILPWYLIKVLWWVWKRYVYGLTGYVFIGVYPFRNVRTYPIDRFKKTITGDATESVMFVMDYSDHLRVANFEFPIKVPSADTSDKIPVSITTLIVARVMNPYEATYGTDEWPIRLEGSAVSAITNFTRPEPLDAVLSAKGTLVDELTSRVVRTTHAETAEFGIEVSKSLLLDISPAEGLTEMQKRLADVALARVDRAAQKIRAEGAAAQLTEQIRAVKEAGNYGLAVLASERDVRTASAAPVGSIVNIGGSSGSDPINAAILQELRKNDTEGDS